MGSHLRRTNQTPDPAAHLPATMTEHETGVLHEMARGLSNAEIGKRLYLSAATVTTHVTAILAKLGVRDRLQAVSAAYQSGAVGPHAATEPSNSTSVIDSKPGQWPYPVRDGGSVARCGRCHGGGHGQETLEDARTRTPAGASAVAFEVELALDRSSAVREHTMP